MIRAAASISARWEKAWGKLPRWRAGARVELLGVQAERRGDPQELFHQVARALLLADDRQAETSQKEQIRKLPSLPDMPSSVSSVR